MKSNWTIDHVLKVLKESISGVCAVVQYTLSTLKLVVVSEDKSELNLIFNEPV